MFSINLAEICKVNRCLYLIFCGLPLEGGETPWLNMLLPPLGNFYVLGHFTSSRGYWMDGLLIWDHFGSLPTLPSCFSQLLSQLYFIVQLNTHNIAIHFQDSNSKACKTLLGKFGCKVLFVIYDHNFSCQKHICIYILYRLPSVDAHLIQIAFIFFDIILLPKFIPALS